MCIIFCCKGHGSSCEACLQISFQEGKYDCLRCLTLQIEFAETLLKLNSGNIEARKWHNSCAQALQQHFPQAASSVTVHRVHDTFDRFSGLGEDSALGKAYILPIGSLASSMPSATLAPSHPDEFALQPAFSGCSPKTVFNGATFAPADVPTASDTLDLAYGYPPQLAYEPFIQEPLAQKSFAREYLAQDHYDLSEILAEFPPGTPSAHPCPSAAAVNGCSPKTTSCEAISAPTDMLTASGTFDFAHGHISQLAQEPFAQAPYAQEPLAQELFVHESFAQEPFAQDHYDLADIMAEFPPTTPSANACSPPAAVTMNHSHQSALHICQCSNFAGADMNDLAPTAHEAVQVQPAHLAWFGDESLAMFGTISGSTTSSASNSFSQSVAPKDIFCVPVMAGVDFTFSPTSAPFSFSSFESTRTVGQSSSSSSSTQQRKQASNDAGETPARKAKARKRHVSRPQSNSPRKALGEQTEELRSNWRRCTKHSRISEINQSWLDECKDCRMCGTVSALISKLRSIDEATRSAIREAAGKKKPSAKAAVIGGHSIHAAPIKSKNIKERLPRIPSQATLDLRREKEADLRALLDRGNAGREELEKYAQLERVELLYALIKQYGVPAGSWL